jgi:hypothetical protein
MQVVQVFRSTYSHASRLGFKWAFLPLLLLLVLSSNHAFAATTITTANLGANQVTLQITSDSAGLASLTLLNGASATCGSAAQTVAGKDNTGTVAFRIGSLTLAAGTTGNYTVRNLVASTAYTVCVAAADGTLVSTSVTTNAAADLSANTWKAVGTAGFSDGSADRESLAFAPDGTPYVAYVDNYSNRATVKKFNGTSWVTVGAVASVGSTAYESLAFAPDGTLYLAYEDVYNNQGATVMKYNGSSWVTVGSVGFGLTTASGTASTTTYQSLAISPNGTPYLAFSATIISSGYIVPEAWKFDGSAGVEMSVTVIPGETDAVFESLAFAPDGTPYFGYEASDGPQYAAAIMRYDGSTWSVPGNIAAGGVSGTADGFTSLAFGPDGNPYLAYSNGANSAKASVYKYDGSAWGLVGTADFSAGATYT